MDHNATSTLLESGDDEYCVNTSEAIGKGKFGTVYKGFRKSDHYAVAVKEVASAAFKVDDETKTLWQLYHPHIVTMLACIERDEHVYIVMELCWTNLEELLKHIGCFDRLQLQQAVQHLFGGYKALADTSIIHCDIKPENVLVHLQPDGGVVLKLSDLGSSKLAEADDFASGGDTSYMAPEIGAIRMYTGAKITYTAAADLWSMGLVINESSGGRKLSSQERCQIFAVAYERKYENVENIVAGLLRAEIEGSARSLIAGLLEVNVERRLTVSKVFDLPYVRSKTADIAIRLESSTLTSVRGCVPYDSIVKLKRQDLGRRPRPRPYGRRKQSAFSRLRNVMLCGLSDVSLDSVRENLANYYLSEFAQVQTSCGESIPVGDIFVQLSLSKGSEEPLVGYETVIADFLMPVRGRNEHEKAMLLWAQPGFGKTTIIKKLAFDWASQVERNGDDESSTTSRSSYYALLSNVDLLLVFPLRNHSGGQCAKLKDMILQPPVVSKKDGKFIEKWLRSKENRSRALVVLDGFDELSKPDACSELYSVLFDSTKLPDFPLLITSRPYAVQHARLRSAQITGISESAMEVFIQRHCSNGDELVKYIRQSSSSTLACRSMYSCPLLLQLFCSLFAKLHTLPSRQTDLYQEIFMWMVAKDREKQGGEVVQQTDFEAFAKETFVTKLARFAFKNTVVNDVKLIFTEEELRNSEVNTAEATRIGLLVDGSLCASTKWPVKIGTTSAQLSFGHASFQEFFAAIFAAGNLALFEIAFSKMEQKRCLSEQFLVFFCGLCESSGRSSSAQAVRRCLEEKFQFENSFERQIMLGREFNFEGMSFSLALFFDFITLLKNECVSAQIRIDALAPILNRIRDESYGMPLLAFLHNPVCFLETQQLVCSEIVQSVTVSKFSILAKTHFCIAEFVYSKVDRALCVVHVPNVDALENVQKLTSKRDCFYDYGHVSAFRFRGSVAAFVDFIKVCKFTTDNVQIFFEAKCPRQEHERVPSDVADFLNSSGEVQITQGGYLTLYLHDRDLNRNEAADVSKVLRWTQLDLLAINCLWSKSPARGNDFNDDSGWEPQFATRRLCIVNANISYLRTSPTLRMLLRRSVPEELQLTSCEITSDDFLKCGFPSRIRLLDCVAVDAGSLGEVAKIAQTIAIRDIVITLCALSSALAMRGLLRELNSAMLSPQLQFCDCPLSPECEAEIRDFPYRSSVWLNGSRLIQR